MTTVKNNLHALTCAAIISPVATLVLQVTIKALSA